MENILAWFLYKTINDFALLDYNGNGISGLTILFSRHVNFTLTMPAAPTGRSMARVYVGSL